MCYCKVLKSEIFYLVSSRISIHHCLVRLNPPFRILVFIQFYEFFGIVLWYSRLLYYVWKFSHTYILFSEVTCFFFGWCAFNIRNFLPKKVVESLAICSTRSILIVYWFCSFLYLDKLCFSADTFFKFLNHLIIILLFFCLTFHKWCVSFHILRFRLISFYLCKSW